MGTSNVIWPLGLLACLLHPLLGLVWLLLGQERKRERERYEGKRERARERERGREGERERERDEGKRGEG